MSFYQKKQLNDRYPDTRVDFVGRNDLGNFYAKQKYRCPICNNFQIRSFASIYGRGVRTSVSRRGRFFKRGYTTNTSKSLIADKCAPPEKRKYALGVFLLCSALALGASMFCFNMETMEQAIPDISMIASSVALIFGWAGLYLVVRSGLWNSRTFPELQRVWSISYLCERCGTIVMI